MSEYETVDRVEDRDAVLRILSGEGYGGEANIRCPECASDYSHLREVFSRQGSDPNEGGAGGLGLEVRGATSDRRAAVVIVFEGECGHRWELIIQQHKGINLLRFARLRQVVTSPDGRRWRWAGEEWEPVAVPAAGDLAGS